MRQSAWDYIKITSDISTQLLIKNGKMSSGKETKHIKAKFFLIKDRVDNGEIRLIDCPTEVMWVDIMTNHCTRDRFPCDESRADELSSKL